MIRRPDSLGVVGFRSRSWHGTAITPRPAIKGVMVSSTFKDLEEHRAKLIKTLHRQKLFAIEIEDRSSKPDDDVIPSSLNMVRDASGYIGLTSHRYGQVPEDDERNPDAYSMTRLGFEEAKRLGLPTLIFVMGADHPVKAGDVEIGPEKRVKLEAFRQRAEDGRIYVVFENLEEFVRQAIHNVSNLAEFLDGQAEPVTTNVPDRSPVLATTEPEPDVIPSPPAFYAEPAYIGSHEFVGCNAQLEVLNDWAAPADARPVLLYEAIGGAGKSMLTWEWVTKHTTDVRDDWAGRFWHSFYERAASSPTSAGTLSHT